MITQIQLFVMIIITRYILARGRHRNKSEDFFDESLSTGYKVGMCLGFLIFLGILYLLAGVIVDPINNILYALTKE